MDREAKGAKDRQEMVCLKGQPGKLFLRIGEGKTRKKVGRTREEEHRSPDRLSGYFITKGEMI